MSFTKVRGTMSQLVNRSNTGNNCTYSYRHVLCTMSGSRESGVPAYWRGSRRSGVRDFIKSTVMNERPSRGSDIFLFFY